MARRNGVWYEGRVINKPREGKEPQCKLSISSTGRKVLTLLIAEDFSEKNKDAPQSKKRPEKGPEDYVTVATAWHKIQVFDSKEGDHPDFIALVTDPNFNHGAVVVVDASYKEDGEPWTDNGGNRHIGRSEKIFFGIEDGGSIGYKDIDGKGKTFGAADGFKTALWDGVSALPKLGGSGGGGPAAPQYGDDEGF